MRSFTFLIKLFNIKQALKDDESKFRLSNGLKLTVIPLISLTILICSVFIFLKMDLAFFRANGFSEVLQLEESYYDFLFQSSLDYLAIFLVFIICILLMGIYISETLIRPFRIIGQYCESFVEKRTGSYDPDFFSDLKLLTRFCEWFFNIVETAKLNDGLGLQIIPSKFTRVHGPVFEKAFFMQFFLFIIITCLGTGILSYLFIVDLHESLISLSLQTLKQKSEVIYFLKSQNETLENIIWGVMLFHVTSYCFLAIHLYREVSGPAFGIFATMRSFAKGKYSSRVHFIGSKFLRPQTRKINKYLSYIEEELTKN